MSANRLKIALPNKGRLREPTIDLFKQAGFKFRAKDRQLTATCSNAPLEFIFLRADDIPVLVDRGVVDVGITGEDLIQEREAEVEVVLPLGYGKCRLCVAAPDSAEINGPDYFRGKTIATSFPVITQRHFSERNVAVQCVEMNGSVEVMIALGLADGIVDLVETGDSLRDNQLRVVEEILTTQTVLISHPKQTQHALITQIKRRLEGILIARQYTLLEYNVPKVRLQEAESITPGFNSPTVSQLEKEDWAAVRVMVEKKNIQEIMDRLEEIGASAILETEIKNCRL